MYLRSCYRKIAAVLFMFARFCAPRVRQCRCVKKNGGLRPSGRALRGPVGLTHPAAADQAPGIGRTGMISMHSPGKIVKCGCFSNILAAASCEFRPHDCEGAHLVGHVLDAALGRPSWSCRAARPWPESPPGASRPRLSRRPCPAVPWRAFRLREAPSRLSCAGWFCCRERRQGKYRSSPCGFLSFWGLRRECRPKCL